MPLGYETKCWNLQLWMRTSPIVGQHHTNHQPPLPLLLHPLLSCVLLLCLTTTVLFHASTAILSLLELHLIPLHPSGILPPIAELRITQPEYHCIDQLRERSLPPFLPTSFPHPTNLTGGGE
jgi:hypothetical protein